MKNISLKIISDLRELVDDIEKFTNEIYEIKNTNNIYGNDEKIIKNNMVKVIKSQVIENGYSTKKHANVCENTEINVSIENVRAVLAEKSKMGKVQEVKKLILKYGAQKLTLLNPSCFEDLLKEAENI